MNKADLKDIQKSQLQHFGSYLSMAASISVHAIDSLDNIINKFRFAKLLYSLSQLNKNTNILHFISITIKTLNLLII
jgi:Cdc6-like AAA superfamily ATPase